MRLTWMGHACFLLESKEGRVVFDPYEPGSVPGLVLPELAAEAVLCSHDHHDHRHASGVKQSKMRPGFTVEKVHSFHDGENGAKRGGNTIHIVTAEGKRIVHMGDIGHLLTPEQVSAIGVPDVLMLPVGGYYTIDAAVAKRICDMLSPRIIIPMHYRGRGFGYEEISELEPFTDQFDHVTVLDTNVLELSDAVSGVIVLRCPGVQ